MAKALMRDTPGTETGSSGPLPISVSAAVPVGRPLARLGSSRRISGYGRGCRSPAANSSSRACRVRSSAVPPAVTRIRAGPSAVANSIRTRS